MPEQTPPPAQTPPPPQSPPPVPPPQPPRQDKSVADLVFDVSQGTSNLIREEFELAARKD